MGAVVISPIQLEASIVGNPVVNQRLSPKLSGRLLTLHIHPYIASGYRPIAIRVLQVVNLI